MFFKFNFSLSIKKWLKEILIYIIINKNERYY